MAGVFLEGQMIIIVGMKNIKSELQLLIIQIINTLHVNIFIINKYIKCSII